MIVRRVRKEYELFRGRDLNFQKLIIGNFIYSCSMPITETFVGAYILRNSRDQESFVLYFICLFLSIPTIYHLNGFLLRWIPIKQLYGFGMILSGLVMLWLMGVGELSLLKICSAGVAMGVSVGLYWANRSFLTYQSTNDDNRNYFYGLESFLGMLCNVLVPIFVGLLFTTRIQNGLFLGESKYIYLFLVMVVVLLSFYSAVKIFHGKYENPQSEPFSPPKDSKIWWRNQVICFFRGLGHGVMLCAPTILILGWIGAESSLGLFAGISNVFAGGALYWIGRYLSKKHRVLVLACAQVLFLIGAVFFGFYPCFETVLLLLVFIALSRPICDWAYGIIQLAGIDESSKKDCVNPYSLILNQEFYVFYGRICGFLMMIFFARKMGDHAALMVVLPSLGLLQFASLIFASKIVVSTLTGSLKN